MHPDMIVPWMFDYLSIAFHLHILFSLDLPPLNHIFFIQLSQPILLPPANLGVYVALHLIQHFKFVLKFIECHFPGVRIIVLRNNNYFIVGWFTDIAATAMPSTSWTVTIAHRMVIVGIVGSPTGLSISFRSLFRLTAQNASDSIRLICLLICL